MSLVLAKLVTSEFIIGRLNGTLITNPTLIQFNANPNTGNVTISLKPYLHPLSNTIGLLISMDKVIATESCNDEMARLYVEFTMKHIQAHQEQNKEDTEGDDGQTRISEHEDTPETEQAK